MNAADFPGTHIRCPIYILETKYCWNNMHCILTQMALYRRNMNSHIFLLAFISCIVDKALETGLYNWLEIMHARFAYPPFTLATSQLVRTFNGIAMDDLGAWTWNYMDACLQLFQCKPAWGKPLQWKWYIQYIGVQQGWI